MTELRTHKGHTVGVLDGDASGKFGEGYTELTTGLETAIDGIRDMGESLRKMQQAIKDTDAALAGQ